MTQEQFNEVLKANERLVEVKKVLNVLQAYDNCMLYLVYDVKDAHGNPHPNTLPYKIVHTIEDKLKNYTKRLIQELNEEVEEINKKIEKI